MSASWTNTANALHTKLAADATLVALLRHSATTPAIGTSYSTDDAPKRYLTIQLFNSRPLTGNATQIKRMRIDLVPFCTKKSEAIAITDRIEYLFDNTGGNNREFFDFSNTAIRVRDTRTALRLPQFFMQDLDRHVEGMRITAIVDPYTPCV